MKRKVLVALWCLLLLPAVAFAQSITISGTVVDPDGEPLIGANVVIESLVLGASTDVEGRYSFDVPGTRAGQAVVLSAKFVGFIPEERTVTLQSGRMTEDFTLRPDLLELEELVVTGVQAETPQKKLAFTVDKVGAEKLAQAPGNSPMSSLQGKVAGAQITATSGQPGDGLSVRLRGSTSISGSSSPLFIVDGVILGANQVDIDALDIESIEIVKGAAASSLYGSRAQNGVVQITTKRGGDVPFNQTRVTVRNEFGISQLPADFEANEAHNLAIDANGNFLNNEGQINSCATCFANGYGPGTVVQKEFGNVSFYDNPYALSGELTNNFDEFFDPGNTWTNYVAVSQNSAKTNFHASFTNLQEQGVIRGLNGYNRKSFRLNLDHRIYGDLLFSASGFYSQSERDEPRASGFNPFFGLMFTNPLTNLARRDESGELLVQADPLAVEENPLYIIENVDTQDDRSRVLGNFRARWSPAEWVDLEGNFSYDRSDRDFTRFADRGTQSIDPSNFNDGQILRQNAISEALNADVTASFRKSFGALTSRAQLKYQAENVENDFEEVVGNTLTAQGIPDLSNVSGDKNVRSVFSTIRSDGLYATVGVDYADKYIADFLIRRDGSSLFGSEERWQTYYRVSGAWRVSEEGFWPGGDVIPEFKLRYSLGTAGGRPEFEAQYETFSLSNGSISKGTLGNAFLKPELQTEQEFGVEASITDRFFAQLVYATAKVEDQLLLVPLPGFFGFNAQWQNAGTIESNTIEASLDANILRSRNTSLDFGLVFDRTDQEITEFNTNAFKGGPISAFYFRDDETIGAMYGIQWIEDTSVIADGLGVPEGADPNAFQVNDDGYLVPVGFGNSFRDGISKGLWGTQVDVTGDGEGDMLFGMPIKLLNEEGQAFTQIGDVLPDFNLGLSTNFRYKGLTAYMLWNAQVGGDVYNFTKQWAYRDGRHSDQDQSGKEDGLKKTAEYYEALYDATATNSHFIEDGTYVKLREVSLGYTLDRRQLGRVFGQALHSVSFSLIGRNLLTFTDYSGWDPDVGDTGSNNTAGGDATLYRVDNFDYPKFRTFTGKIEFTF